MTAGTLALFIWHNFGSLMAIAAFLVTCTAKIRLAHRRIMAALSSLTPDQRALAEAMAGLLSVQTMIVLALSVALTAGVYVVGAVRDNESRLNTLLRNRTPLFAAIQQVETTQLDEEREVLKNQREFRGTYRTILKQQDRLLSAVRKR